MKMIFKIAFRNMIRNLRRTAITIISIALGLAVVLWLQCLMAGATRGAIEQVASTQIGKIQLSHPDYLTDRNVSYFLPKIPDDLRSKLPSEVNYGPRVYLPSLISTSENSYSILLMGVDPLLEKDLTLVSRFPREGEFLAPEDSLDCPSKQIFLGKAMAKLLDAAVGSKIVLLSQALDGSLGNDLYFVKGIYDSGSRDQEKAVAYAPINCARKLAAFPKDAVHEVVLNFKDVDIEKSIQDSLKSAYSPGIHVTTWRDILPRMNTMVKFNNASYLIVSIMLFIVINLGIVNTFLVTVFERTKEFGMMLSLGAPARTVISVVLVECFVMATLASLIGMILGSIAILYHAKTGLDLTPLTGADLSMGTLKLDRIIYPVFKLTSFLKAIFFTILSVCAAGVYPAIRASHLEPVEALRNN